MLPIAPGEEEDAEGGKGSFSAVVLAWGCTSWEPGGRLGRSLKDARRNQSGPWHPSAMPCVLGTAWLCPTLETSPKASAWGDTGPSPQQPPRNWGSLGVQQCRACSSVTAGCGMVLTLGRCQCLGVLWMCLWMSSGRSFGQAGKPPAARKGSTGPAASHPHLSWGGHNPPHPAPLCLSGQDYGLSRSPPQFGSIYHVRGNGTPQPPVLGERRGCSAPGRTRLSQCQTGTGFNSRVPLPDPSPMGAVACLAVGLQTLRGSGRDVGVLRLWG